MQFGKIQIKPLYILLAVVLVVLAAVVIYMTIGRGGTPIVAAGDTVSVYYTGTLTNGTVFDSNVGKQPLQFTVGSGQVIQGFDNGIVGMKINGTKTLTLTPNQSYGEVNPDLVVTIPLTEFGNQTVNVGMIVTRTSSGQQFQGIVTAVNATTATVDFNPPLAGQTLIFTVKVVGIQKKK